jgi:Mlc titration factor MtfA (ptsG expression regulator)
MDPAAWSSAFSAAYRDLGRRAMRRLRTVLDPYDAPSPAEFFAVASEMFFDDPLHLKRGYPAVYAQLALFYRQDPAAQWALRAEAL